MHFINGDQFLDIGTSKELGEKYGVRPKTITFYATKTYHKKLEGNNNRIIAIRVEEE